VTVYIRDDAADTIVAKDEKLQAVVQGRAIMLWLPGQTAVVSVNTCLMFGWMGTTMSVYWMVPQLQYMMHWYAIGIVTVMSLMGLAWISVARGYPLGRSRMYVYANATLAVALCVAAVAVARSDWIAAAMAAVGVALTAVAQRLVAGPSYALFSAFVRAKRAYELGSSSSRA
jgi:hypothetical protein